MRCISGLVELVISIITQNNDDLHESGGGGIASGEIFAGEIYAIGIG